MTDEQSDPDASARFLAALTPFIFKEGSHGARIQTSRSSSVVKITGIALRWIGSTIAFSDVVRKP
jgi:hypothetical protein